jgi:D-3-phosphoglycerate dehydrogenase
MYKSSLYNKKVLITDHTHDILEKGLRDLGMVIDYLPEIPRDEVKKVIKDYTGIVINTRMYMDKEMMDLGADLKFIARLGSGLEIIDLDYARAKGIHVVNSPGGNCNAVGEHALGMLLALANNLVASDREVRSRIWEREKNRGWEIDGRTVGVIGFGHTGSHFARKLRGFDVRILAYDKYKKDYANDWPMVSESSLDEVIEGSDIISLHVPLTEDTKHLVSKTFLGQCKKGCVLINTSRGQVVDTLALVEALERGWLSGACLDVFENEKPSTWSKEEHSLYQRLYDRSNVVLSPHVAGWTVESKKKLSQILVQKISRLF